MIWSLFFFSLFVVTLGGVAVWNGECTKEERLELYLIASQSCSIRGCCRVRQPGEHTENFLFCHQGTSWGWPPLLAPLCLLHHWVRWPQSSTSCLSWDGQWSLTTPIAQQRGALAWTIRSGNGSWDAGLGTCGTSVRGCPMQSGLSPMVYSLCPPVLQFWRGEKHPYYGVELFSPQSHGTMAGFKEEYHLLWRVIDGAMCLVNISASLETLLFTWKSTTNRKVERETGLSPLQKELSYF